MLKAVRSTLMLLLVMASLSAARAQNSTLPEPYTTISLFELTETWMRNLHFSEESYGLEAPLKVTQREWSVTDPERVAREALASMLSIDEKTIK
ncbi:MAG TPA: hypothetical protein VF543_17485 [Pyrinomonadaceae bacterium]|jgi:hypothetical protein